MDSKYRKIIVLVGALVAVFATFVRLMSGGNDWLVVTYGDWGMRVTSWSRLRRVVATTAIPKNVKIWVPGGWGWYESGNLEKVKSLDGRGDLIGRVLFYNFGLVPDLTVSSRTDLKPEEVLFLRGGGRWWWWRLDKDNWIEREDKLLADNSANFWREWDRVAITGYAPVANIKNDAPEWKIYNATGETGLASFLAQRLGWMGVRVSSVGNLDESPVETCEIRLGRGAKNYNNRMVKKLENLWNCDVKNKEGSEGGVELVLGKKWADLLKYNTYVGTF